jgi:thiol:disulfide interchange protein
MFQHASKRFFPLLFVSVLWSSNALSMAAIPALPDTYKSKNPQVKVTLLEFSAPWCVTCQMLKPSIKKLTLETGKELNLLEFNIDDEKNKSLIKRYGVIATPTFVIFNSKGQSIKQLDSEVSGSELRSSVFKALGRKI